MPFHAMPFLFHSAGRRHPAPPLPQRVLQRHAAALNVVPSTPHCCVLQEADILHRLGGSPHVVALHGACVMDQHMVVVMELMQVGQTRLLHKGSSYELHLRTKTKGRQHRLSLALSYAVEPPHASCPSPTGRRPCRGAGFRCRRRAELGPAGQGHCSGHCRGPGLLARQQRDPQAS